MSTKYTAETITQEIASEIVRDALNGKLPFEAIGAEDGNVNEMESEASGRRIIRAGNDSECAVYVREDGTLVIVADANGPIAVIL